MQIKVSWFLRQSKHMVLSKHYFANIGSTIYIQFRTWKPVRIMEDGENVQETCLETLFSDAGGT